MKKFIAFIVVIALIGAGAYYFLNKTDEEKIEARFDSFESAYASGDLEGCLDCLDTKSRNAYKGIGTLGSLIGGKKGIFGFDFGGDTLSALFSLGTAVGNKPVHFAVKSIEFNGEDSATVKVELFSGDENVAENSQGETSLEMVREKAAWYDFWSNDWYIADDFKF